MSPGSVVRRPTKASGAGPDKRRVFYYISQKAIKHGFKACPIKTVSASFMDDLVRGLVLDHLSSSGKVDLRGAERPVRDHWIRELVNVVVVALDRVHVDIAHERVAACMAANKSAVIKRPEGSTGKSSAEPVPTCLLKPAVEEHGEYFRLVLPIRTKHDRAKRFIVGQDGRDLLGMATANGPAARAQLVEAVGLATAWHRELVRSGASIESVARAYGVVDPRVHKLLPLAGLSPTILRDVLSGAIGRSVTLTDLLRAAQSLDWATQTRHLRR